MAKICEIPICCGMLWGVAGVWPELVVANGAAFGAMSTFGSAFALARARVVPETVRGSVHPAGVAGSNTGRNASYASNWMDPGVPVPVPSFGPSAAKKGPR